MLPKIGRRSCGRRHEQDGETRVAGHRTAGPVGLWHGAQDGHQVCGSEVVHPVVVVLAAVVRYADHQQPLRPSSVRLVGSRRQWSWCPFISPLAIWICCESMGRWFRRSTAWCHQFALPPWFQPAQDRGHGADWVQDALRRTERAVHWAAAVSRIEGSEIAF